MKQLHRPAAEQLVDAYVRMADEAKYRPAAPSDGMGNITVPEESLDLDAEAIKYAHGWWDSENEMSYWIGCPSFPDRAALVFIVEAARNLCGVERGVAADLLRMALAEVEGTP